MTNDPPPADPQKKSLAARLLRPKVAIPLLIVFLILISPLLYRGWRLGQVPVIEPPFDVEEFLTEIPDDENAYFGFEQAWRELIPLPDADEEQYDIELETGWDLETTVLDKHLAINRIALKTWRAATEKDRFQPPVEYLSSGVSDIEFANNHELNRLACIQIQKLIRTNQPVDAIPWINAQLRFDHLIRQKGSGINYMVGVAYFSQASRGINDWAVHPELRRRQIDQIREEVETARQLNPRLSNMIKVECIADKSTYDRWSTKTARQLNELNEMLGKETFLESDWRAWLEAEPAYTVRLIPHITQNRLLFIEAERRDRPPLINDDLFEDSTASPAERGDLRAAELAELIEGSFILTSPQLRGPLSFIDRDEARYRCLTVALAAQAYFRDRGEFPEKASELVPEYLDEIPDDLYSPTPAPLIYRRDGDGAVVYSRFDNQVDDGGFEIDYDENAGSGELMDFGYRIRNPFDRPISAPKP